MASARNRSRSRARARSRSPVISHGEQWAIRYYCALKLRIGVAGKRVNSSDFVHVGDHDMWLTEGKQRSPSSLITSLIKCVEDKCHDDLECLDDLESTHVLMNGFHHEEFKKWANCLLVKLILEHPVNLNKFHDSICEALDDLHAYCIQRSIWKHILNEMVVSGADRHEWEFSDEGQRNAAVDCLEKNIRRCEDNMELCKATMFTLKLHKHGPGESELASTGTHMGMVRGHERAGVS